MAVFNEPNQWKHPLGNNADISTLPDNAVATAGIASLQKLFQIINATPLEAGGIAPGREDVNALFKYLGDQIFYTQNGGIPSYNADYDYVAGRVVLYNGNLYKCIRANGASSTVVAPDSNTAYWQRLDNFVRSVNGVTADISGNVQLGNIGAITGEIKWFAFNTPPEGYLACNGATVSRTTYADLFAIIGTTFGSGNGSTTFTLPNLIDKFAQGSTRVGTYKSAGLPSIAHTHSLEQPLAAYTTNRTLSTGSYTVSDKSSAIYHTGGIREQLNSIYGNSTTVQPPALTLLPCIKY